MPVVINVDMPQHSVQELQDSLVEAAADARNGRTLSSEQVYQNLEQKFPGVSLG